MRWWSGDTGKARKSEGNFFVVHTTSYQDNLRKARCDASKSEPPILSNLGYEEYTRIPQMYRQVTSITYKNHHRPNCMISFGSRALCNATSPGQMPSQPFHHSAFVRARRPPLLFYGVFCCTPKPSSVLQCALQLSTSCPPPVRSCQAKGS